MKVLLVEPGKHPRTVEIEHTLEAMYGFYNGLFCFGVRRCLKLSGTRRL